MKIDYPKEVYKYRDWTNEYHQNILKKNEVFLSSPKDFNDPFDCRITPNFSVLNSDEKIEEFVNYLFKRHQGSVDMTAEEKEKVYHERIKELKTNLDGFQQRADKMSIDMQNDVFGILSLSCIWDNLLMWSHYGNNHKGFCVGFHEEVLRKSDLFGSGGKVIYDEKFPEISPMQELNETDEERAQRYYQMSHFKAMDWSYEKEYRLMKTYPKRWVTNDERKVVVPDEAYLDITLGCEFPKEQISEVQSIAEEKKIPLYQGTKVPFEFKLERTPIYLP
ncbi:MAG: DUF2971 domain-containing protein [Crocinitomicaceae bacterium]